MIPSVRTKMLKKAMDFTELAKERYSCRSLSEKPVEREKIEEIIRAGLVAPTAHNNQPYRIYVVESEEMKERIGKTTPYTFGASVFLIVAGKPEETWTRASDQKNFVDVDAAITATHMMLKIQELGLGTTWVGSFDEPKLKQLIPELQGDELIAIFPVGYPGESARPSRLHGLRRAASELVRYI